MKDKLYVAYGSNLNFRQMSYRCPTATLYGVGELKDYELQFKGHPENAYATIAPQVGASVPVAVWRIKPSDEAALDRYEGFPSHYYKETVRVSFGRRSFEAMVYVMNQSMKFGLPSQQYYRTVREGYNDCRFEVKLLNEAVRASEDRIEPVEEEYFGLEMM